MVGRICPNHADAGASISWCDEYGVIRKLVSPIASVILIKARAMGWPWCQEAFLDINYEKSEEIGIIGNTTYLKIIGYAAPDFNELLNNIN